MNTEDSWSNVGNHPGSIRITVSRCEIEGIKTVHIDAWKSRDTPYGHLSMREAKSLKKFLEKAIEWSESGENESHQTLLA